MLYYVINFYKIKKSNSFKHYKCFDLVFNTDRRWVVKI